MRKLGVGSMEKECRSSSDESDCDTKTMNWTKLVKGEMLHILYEINDTE